jgi:hypothetical protein
MRRGRGGGTPCEGAAFWRLLLTLTRIFFLYLVFAREVGFQLIVGLLFHLAVIAEGTLWDVKMAPGVDDLEMALLISLYVVLLQAIGESQLYLPTDDHTFLESTLGSGSSLDSHYVQVAVSTAALYDYRLSCGLLCFDDELRYWVKPRSTTWFSSFFISLYDDS